MNARAARRRWRVSCDCATATAASYHFPLREIRLRFFSNLEIPASASLLPESTSCTAFQDSLETWLYLLFVAREGRAIAFWKVRSNSPMNGLFARLSLSFQSAGLLG